MSTRLGIEQIPPLTPRDLEMDLSPSSPGGLILAGSYVPKTTAQLDALVHGRGPQLETIILEVDKLLQSSNAAEQIVLEAADRAGQLIVDGKDVLLMTSRQIITGSDERSSLNIGAVVANALVLFLLTLRPRPRYLIAKVRCRILYRVHHMSNEKQGGITASDAATKGLSMKRAKIVGQAAAGVPLWRCNEPTSRWAGIRKTFKCLMAIFQSSS